MIFLVVSVAPYHNVGNVMLVYYRGESLCPPIFVRDCFVASFGKGSNLVVSLCNLAYHSEVFVEHSGIGVKRRVVRLAKAVAV